MAKWVYFFSISFHFIPLGPRECDDGRHVHIIIYRLTPSHRRHHRTRWARDGWRARRCTLEGGARGWAPRRNWWRRWVAWPGLRAIYFSSGPTATTTTTTMAAATLARWSVTQLDRWIALYSVYYYYNVYAKWINLELYWRPTAYVRSACDRPKLLLVTYFGYKPKKKIMLRTMMRKKTKNLFICG